MGLKPRERCSAKQLNAIKMMVEHPEWSNIKVGQEVGVSNVSISNWFKLPYFQEELDRQLQEAWKDSRRMAQKTMQRLMNEGNFQATKYILDSCGYAPSQDINLNTGELEVTIIGKKEE